MKIKILSAAIMAAVALVSCNNSAPQMDEKSTATAGEQSIVYVEVDSLTTQYQFCKDYTNILQKKYQNIQRTLNQKGQALQQAAQNFQQKLQQNAYTQNEAQTINANLQRQQQQYQELQQRLASELDQETAKYNEALHDSLAHFLKAYNKDKKYSMILSKSGDNILYADKALDITADVINGLNKTYKPTKELKEAKEEKKEEKK